MRRGHAAWWLVCLLFACGCPGAKPPARSGAAPLNPPAVADSDAPEDSPKDEVASVARILSPGNSEALSVLTKEHFAAVKLDVDKLRRSPLIEKLPGDFDEMLVQIVQVQSPLDFSEQASELELLVAAASPGTWRFDRFMMQERVVGDDDPPLELNAPDEATEPPIHATIYARFKTEKTIAELRELYAQADDARRVKYGCGEYFKGLNVPIYFYFGTRHVVIASQESLIRAAIDNAGKPVDGPLTQRLGKMNLDADFVAAGMLRPVRESLNDLFKSADGVPPQVTIAVEKLDAFSLAIDLEAKEIIKIHADAVDSEGAQLLNDTVKGLLALANFGLAGQMKHAREGDAPAEELEFVKFAQRTLGQVLVQRDAAALDVSLARPRDLDEVVSKAAAVAAAAARRTTRMNNGHNISIAAFRHLAGGKSLQNKQDAQGKPIESWRMQLVPYLAVVGDENETPPVMKSDFAPAPGATTWKLVAPLDQIRGAHARIMFLETGKGTAVPWQQPDEFTFDPDNPQAALGEEPEGGYVAVFADGHVEMLDTAALVERLTSQLASDAPP